MKPEEVTAQILEAWDEMDAEAGAVVTEPEPESEPAPETEPEPEPEEKDDDEGEEGAEVEEPEESEPEEPEEGEAAAAAEPEPPEFEDVEIQAFLSKYGGDVEKALKGAAELQRLMGRQGAEKSELAKQVEQLQAQLVQAQAFGGGAGYLNEEQREWVEGAAESANPGVFVQQAIQAGEFDLARAVCREWAQANPFEAMRAGQVVDAVEFQIQQQANAPQAVPPATTWEQLSGAYPELRTYEEQMVRTLERLGPDHPLVQEARSTDQAQAARGILGIYEIAKAATFALTETKNGLKEARRKEADDAIDAAAVTSGTNTPSAGETPRPRTLMPGLTEDQFEAAFAPQ